MADEFAMSCPTPLNAHDRVMMAHGGGGVLMHRLIEDVFLSRLGGGGAEQHDSAVLDVAGVRLAFTTDSFVVKPIFFPGGDIGSLAVHGTVNDLAMSGAKPLYLSAGFVLEEGFAISELERVTASMSAAAEAVGVKIVTGDTKVVDRGKGDGVYINTAGIGLVEHDLKIGAKSVEPGDVVLVNGDIGRHGMAIMAKREGLAFETTIESDSAPVWDAVSRLLDAGIAVHCLRDLTRGGLASALNEVADAAGVHIELEERDVPVRNDVRSGCELLGFDPLYVACEGRFMVVVSAGEADQALSVLRGDDDGSGAAIIGAVREASRGMVTMRTSIGSSRVVDMLSGEQLPRIC